MERVIISTAPDGYHRAGLVLAQGINRVLGELGEAELAELRADPRTILVERDLLPDFLVEAIKAEGRTEDAAVAGLAAAMTTGPLGQPVVAGASGPDLTAIPDGAKAARKKGS